MTASRAAMIETFSAPIWLVRIFDAARSTAILRSAIELDVFSKLDGKRSEPAAVAAEIGCPVRGTTMLLRALVALDLLDEKGGRFSLTAAAETYLVPGKPEYVGGFAAIVCNQNVWNGLGRLTDAIRNDGTILAQHAETPENPFWQTFAHSGEAMAFPAGLAIERALHGWIAEKPRARVLDLGAGSGIYGFLILERNPRAELTAVEWPNVVPEMKSWAARLGVDERRVRYLPGDLLELEYGGPYDLVLLSHIYHHFDRPTCAALTKKVAASLAPGGRVAVHEFLGDHGRSGMMFGITMLVWTRQGEAYTTDDYRRFFADEGLQLLSRQDSIGMPTSVLIAEKR